MKAGFLLLFFTISLFFLSACEHTEGAGTIGNSGGSPPINDEEAKDYQQAVLKCYKTGGSRVVKIEGELRCF